MNQLVQTAYDYVQELLSDLPKNHYHNFEHAVDVMNRAVYLAEKKGLSPEEIEILSLACLFHDTGFIETYDNNETIGAKIAREYLEEINYDPKKIEQIEQIIIASDPGYKVPKSIFEEIIKDADLDNLGRDDFFTKAQKVRTELKDTKNIEVTDTQWNNSLIVLIQENNFFTDIQKEERLAKKKENFQAILQQQKSLLEIEL